MDTETLIGGRPPIVAVVGHIDHGKSTLLDYIRKTKIVEGEAGGITQHLSAYQATHKNAAGDHLITFLDTPGHEAFAAMRSRGLRVADVAILVVSAEEGAKPQTLEALKLIQEAAIPYVVAFTKIDKPGANLERAKMSMLEHQVFLEGMGGEIPWVAISSKSGEGIPELLDLLLLAAELEGISADAEAPGRGLVIEAHVDPKRGSTATTRWKGRSDEMTNIQRQILNLANQNKWAEVAAMASFLAEHERLHRELREAMDDEANEREAAPVCRICGEEGHTWQRCCND